MKRTPRGISALVGATGMLIGGATASFAGGSPADSSLGHNGSNRHRIYAAPFTSSLCGFDVAVTSTVDREYQTDEYDASGFLARSTVTGPLVSKVTRVDNGRSILLNDSGKGIFDYRSDGSFRLTSTGHLMYGLHPGDIPDQPGLFNTSGRTVIEFTATGQRTVTHPARHVQSICASLS